MRKLIFLPTKVLPWEMVVLALGFALTPWISPLFSPIYWLALGNALGIK